MSEIKKSGGDAVAVKADVAREDDIVRMYKEVDRELGRLTHLGEQRGGRWPSRCAFADADSQMIKEVVDLNVTGAMLVAREAVKRISTASGGKGGAIVNISSMAATLGAPGEYVWYAASKGAIDSFTIGLSREVVKEGIRVNAVSPGLIETDIHATGGQPDRVKRSSTRHPDGTRRNGRRSCGRQFFLLSDQASYITGTNVRVSGGR